MRKQFRDLISPEEFQSLIDRFSVSRRTERIDLNRARGRVNASDVFASNDVPPFSRSLMDGYAVLASDTYGADEENPVYLNPAGSLNIGTPSSMEVVSGTALEIATGAEVPEGANAVVMVEDTDIVDEKLEVRTSVAPSENILNAGSDISMGDLIVRKNTTITPMEIAKMSACGDTDVEVYRGPRVGIISTGPELVPPGEEIGPSQIYDINSSLLESGIEEAGGVPELLGIVNDDEEKLREVLEIGRKKYDLLVTSGSTSAGPHDMIYDVLGDRGEILAHGVKIKPGKPTVLGIIGDVPVFGLPGNPSSAYVIFMNFVSPFIKKLAGQSKAESRTVPARLTETTRSESGRLEQKFVGLVTRGDETKAYPINKTSGAVTLLAHADGFVEIPEGVTYLSQNEAVEVNLLSEDRVAPKLLIIGSNCKGLHRLLNHLDFHLRYLSRGSTGGVNAIEAGVADLAGIHIWTPDGYNVPFLEDRGIQDVILLRGYSREQGLIIKNGNPKNINSIMDVIEKDVNIVNRTGGSGTRIMFDHLLEQVAGELGIGFSEVRKQISGYHVELSTHSAVAAAVKGCKADVGVGIRTVAGDNDLDFLKLQDERFDLLCRKDCLEGIYGKKFKELLGSDEFASELKGLPGLTPGKNMGDVIFTS